MVIFHSYVSLLEGILRDGSFLWIQKNWRCPRADRAEARQWSYNDPAALHASACLAGSPGWDEEAENSRYIGVTMYIYIYTYNIYIYILLLGLLLFLSLLILYVYYNIFIYAQNYYVQLMIWKGSHTNMYVCT